MSHFVPERQLWRGQDSRSCEMTERGESSGNHNFSVVEEDKELVSVLLLLFNWLSHSEHAI